MVLRMQRFFPWILAGKIRQDITPTGRWRKFSSLRKSQHAFLR
jgi:hypothetical protein